MSRAASRWLPALFATATFLFLLVPRPARAQLRTCVDIVAPAREAGALDRLVRAEVDRHPTHHAAATGCQAYLTVELIDLGGQERWVTGRIDTQVPQRERVGADGLGPAVERLLTVVLHNDPVLLRGPGAEGWLARSKRALEIHSVTHYGLEVYEIATSLGSSLDGLPGVALALRREVSAFYVGARVGGAFQPSTDPARLHLRAQFDAQAEVTVYAVPAASTSLFAGALIGLVYQRFQGPAALDGAGATGTATATGLSLALRGGVEALRTSDVRILGFVQLEAPAFVSRDADHGVVDRWVPSASVGAGLLF